MNIMYRLFIFLIALLLITCNQKNTIEKERYEAENSVGFKEVIDDVPPPNVSDLNSNFKTLQAWLTHISGKEEANKDIETFSFGLFESKKEYIVYIVGLNKYEKGPDNTEIRIDFEPKNMYYKLSERECKGLSRAQVHKSLKSQLREFTKTNNFKYSFLAKANVVSEFDQDTIWSAK